jgi:hypothetical protein
LVTSGLRDIFRYLVEHDLVDCVVTSAGGVEEDLIKCLAPTQIGFKYFSHSTCLKNTIQKPCWQIWENSRFFPNNFLDFRLIQNGRSMAASKWGESGRQFADSKRELLPL